MRTDVPQEQGSCRPGIEKRLARSCGVWHVAAHTAHGNERYTRRLVLTALRAKKPPFLFRVLLPASVAGHKRGCCLHPAGRPAEPSGSLGSVPAGERGASPGRAPSRLSATCAGTCRSGLHRVQACSLHMSCPGLLRFFRRFDRLQQDGRQRYQRQEEGNTFLLLAPSKKVRA